MDTNTADTRPVIFHLLTAFGIGGAERLVERLMSKLTEYRHVVISLKGDGPIRRDFEKAGLQTEILHVRYPFSVSGFFAFRRLVKQYRPVVLTTCLVHADLIGRVWGKLCGIPRITSYLVARYRGRRFWLVTRLMAWTDWFVDQYIAISSEVQRYFVEDVHLPKEKLTLIANSIDTSVFVPNVDPEVRKKVFQQLRLPLDSIIVGTVANLREEKCIERLVRALPGTFKQCPNASCIIVGKGVCRAALEKTAQQLHVSDRVRFVSFWPDIMEILPVIDIFVLPSAFEGMSMALLEAMATARAIIATDTPENREVVTKESGLLVDTSNAEKLAGAIVSLLKSPERRKQLGIGARKRVEQHFSLAQSVKELGDFYRKVISES